jgi:glycerol uptake operon antiterminator
VTAKLDIFKSFIIIPSVLKLENFDAALNSKSGIVLLTDVNIGNLQPLVSRCHQKNKLAFVNIDLVGGLSNDQIGIRLLKNLFKVDGITSSNSANVNFSKSIGLYAVQRFFLIDSRSLRSGLNVLKATKSDAIEILPGPLAIKFKDLIKEVKDVHLIGGGFIEDKDSVIKIYHAGFSGVTTSNRYLWNSFTF